MLSIPVLIMENSQFLQAQKFQNIKKRSMQKVENRMLVAENCCSINYSKHNQESRTTLQFLKCQANFLKE